MNPQLEFLHSLSELWKNIKTKNDIQIKINESGNKDNKISLSFDETVQLSENNLVEPHDHNNSEECSNINSSYQIVEKNLLFDSQYILNSACMNDKHLFCLDQQEVDMINKRKSLFFDNILSKKPKFEILIADKQSSTNQNLYYDAYNKVYDEFSNQ